VQLLTGRGGGGEGWGDRLASQEQNRQTINNTTQSARQNGHKGTGRRIQLSWLGQGLYRLDRTAIHTVFQSQHMGGTVGRDRDGDRDRLA
jgi:hypothetical protein